MKKPWMDGSAALFAPSDPLQSDLQTSDPSDLQSPLPAPTLIFRNIKNHPSLWRLAQDLGA